MTGFTFMWGRKDVFVQTERKNKTGKLAGEILTKLAREYDLGIGDHPDVRKELLYYMQKAECEIKTLSNGKQMYDIHGENFGGRGTFVDDGNTIIIKL